MADSPLVRFLDVEPGLATLQMPAAPGPLELPWVDGLLAGAAEIDITPAPGLPKAGHSKNAQDGNGFRTRLRARVIHLRAGRSSIALVAGDMHAGSAVVHRLVADAVAADTDIPLSGLFLGATHTHAAPGQFHGCDFYNRWASNRPGFDPAYTKFLVDRLAEATRRAWATRAPARLAAGSTEVWGFTRNRSLAPHTANLTVQDKRLDPQRKYASINPWLHLLRVDGAATDGGYSPLAALAIFSIHGTGISRHDPAYNADVWAYITGELSARIEAATGVKAVVGAVEGSHGDMTPAVRSGMLVYPEAERVGRGIGEAAASLYDRLEPSLTSEVSLAAGYREIDLAERPCVGGVVLPNPAIGAAKLAGAIENNSPVVDRVPPFRAGHPKPPFLARSDQGSKWVFAGRTLQYKINPVGTFPRILPIQILCIGPIAVLAVPFEVTVEAGRRLEVSTAQALGTAMTATPRVVVSSVANDYWDYLTTPEEYHLQYYEGASNLYGPQTHTFVTGAAAGLARDLARTGDVCQPMEQRRFDFHMHRYLPSATNRKVIRRQADPARFVEATDREDAYWEFTWLDVAPGDLDWPSPMIAVESLQPDGLWASSLDGDGRTVDDQGWRVGVTHEGVDPSGADRYRARWYGPPVGRPGRHRFVVLSGGGRPELAGSAFD